MAAPEAAALFGEGVRAVLGGWAALQLAVAEGFGGPHGPEKAAWMVGVVQDFISQNAPVAPQALELFLAELMDNEFDTAVEDGSLEQVSLQLLTLFSWAHRGDTAGVAAALGTLAKRGPALATALATARQATPSDQTTPSNQATPTSEATPPEGGAEEEEGESSEEEAMEVDGWTLVRRRRR